MFILCYWYGSKLELCWLVALILLKIKFGHIEISVHEIGIPMSKTVCANPCVPYRITV